MTFNSPLTKFFEPKITITKTTVILRKTEKTIRPKTVVINKNLR